MELIQSLTDQKNAAYTERNQLIALLATHYPAELWRDAANDCEDDWRWIVAIELPTGQVTWHIHDSEKPRFDWLMRAENRWDGHTTQEKYKRIEEAIAKR